MLTELLDRIARLRRGPASRPLIGIAGAPGAGKTTLARRLVAELGCAVAVPMDGFHLANVELRRLGRAQVKGAPDTFDAAGYLAVLRRLRERTDEVVYAPAFDHILDEPVAGSIPVPPQTEVVVTEGNYLLLDLPPWNQVRPLLDLAVYLAADDSVRVAGLLRRHRAKGRDAEAAHDWVHRSDEANARLVAAAAHRADLLLRR